MRSTSPSTSAFTTPGGAVYVFVPGLESPRRFAKALAATLNGDISELREAIDEQHGDWSTRGEVSLSHTRT